MVLGLPLLRLLSLTQFKAALIHEFGHFSGTEIRFSAWAYRARASVFHTLQGLPRVSGAPCFLGTPVFFCV